MLVRQLTAQQSSPHPPPFPPEPSPLFLEMALIDVLSHGVLAGAECPRSSGKLLGLEGTQHLAGSEDIRTAMLGQNNRLSSLAPCL